MKTLYVTDLDGTLLNQSAKVSEYSIGIINRLTEEGLDFTYATARSLVSAQAATCGLAVKMPVIAYNGAFIYKPDTGEVLHSVKFTAREMRSAREVMENNGISPLVYSVLGGTDRLSWDVDCENDGIRNYLSRRKGDRRLRPLRGSDRLYDGEVFYFTCVGSREELTSLYDGVRADDRYVCNFQKELYQPEYFCEIMPGQATKANAIVRLKEMLRYDRVVSFGDALNDIPMFEISDECYAVENAVEQLKAIATGVIGTNEQDGVARWLLNNF